LHLHYALSLLLSLLVVNWVGLLLNRCWTFESTKNPFWAEALRYWSANALSALGVLAATTLLVEVLHVHYLFANVLIAMLFLIGNFLLHQVWTFRARPPLSSAGRRRVQ
jgi:putative flippase GtrA